MKPVPISVAKTHLSDLIKRACAGEEVVIARGDTPVVRLVPIEAAAPRRRFGELAGQLEVPDAIFDPLPPEELALWSGGGS
jgi:prevent-host-death family protein